MKSGKVVVEGLYKVFGNQPKTAMEMLASGRSKEQIFSQTGQVVGVHNVSFEVQEGEIFVLMGLSGSGKSTLIRLINRLIEPTAGSVCVDGHDIARMPRSQLINLRRRDMSMVFQSFARWRVSGAKSVNAARSMFWSKSAWLPLRRNYRVNYRAACSSVSAWHAPWP